MDTEGVPCGCPRSKENAGLGRCVYDAANVRGKTQPSKPDGVSRNPGIWNLLRGGTSPVLAALLSFLVHNDNHYVEVQIGNRTMRLCTRCTGITFGFPLTLPFLVAFPIYEAAGLLVAGISVLLFLPDFLYWALTRAQRIPDLKLVRVAAGFLLGVSIATYGQADLLWSAKIAIPTSIFVTWMVADRLVGRRKPHRDRSSVERVPRLAVGSGSRGTLGFRRRIGPLLRLHHRLRRSNRIVRDRLAPGSTTK